jgi:hypothetical protein
MPPTEYTFSELRRGLAHYQTRTGALPDSLGAMCPGNSRDECPWRSSLFEYRDTWRRPVLYSRVDGEFELRSAGPDGVASNSDDLVFRPSLERAVVARIASCYKISLPWWKEYPYEWLDLLPESTSVGHYRASPVPGIYRVAYWQPISADSIIVAWVSQHHAREFHLRIYADSLVGRARLGAGFASGRGERLRPHRVVAFRSNCRAPTTTS